MVKHISLLGPSVQDPRLSNNDTLKVVSVVKQIITGISEAVAKKKDRMVITEMVLNETKWLLEFIGQSKSQHLMQMAFGGGVISSANSCKTYIYMWLCSQRHISKPMRSSLFQIIILCTSPTSL
jgi:hypothetical protein